MSKPNPRSARGSRFLSLVLRHKPQTIGLSLDAQGWANIDELIERSRDRIDLTRERLLHIVANNNKQRFAVSEDGLRIRANQGHSIAVDLELEPQVPPALLFHGTPEKFVDAILAEGLLKKQRQHVHLSADLETATLVGKRRGAPVVLLVDAEAMTQAGFIFYLSENKVWLVDHVPVQFIRRQVRSMDGES